MSSIWVLFLVLFVAGPISRWGWASFGYRGGRYADGRDRIDTRRFNELMTLLEQRNQDLELLQSRVTELENRLDFTERLLAERRNELVTGG